MSSVTIDTNIDTESELLISQRERKEKLRLLGLVIAISLTALTTLGAVAAIALAAVGIGGTLADFIALGVMYLVTMLGVEVGYHRYFTHRAFKAKPWFSKLLGIFGSMSLQGPLVWWAAIHRLHHSHTDTHLDPHSPYRDENQGKIAGFYHSHMGWLFNYDCVDPEDWGSKVKDLYSDKGVFKVHMQYWYWAILGVVLPGIVEGLVLQSWQGFFTGVLWGGLLRAFLGLHFFWALNSVCHTFGSSPFRQRDESKNNLLVALVTLGQGWHHNHHAFPFSAKVGLLKGQVDFGWMMLLGLEKIGAVYDLRQPKQETIEKSLAV